MDLVDTDILVDVQRGHPPAIEWFASLTDLPAVPGYVVMELIQDARNQGEVRNALKLVGPLPIVWPTPADCAQALADFAANHLAHGVGLIDALIAATARGLNGSLLTFNERHYRPLQNLMIRRPYQR